MEETEEQILKAIQEVRDFLEKNPSEKNPKNKESISQNIRNGFTKVIAPNEPTTTPDDLTSEVLEIAYDHPSEDRKKIQKQYLDQKQAEMMIGELLERYIYSKGQKYGWVFTAECIGAVDFIKRTDNGWTSLQIKNSDNSENSSSKSVRDKTEIMFWFRRYSEQEKITPTLKKNGELSKRSRGYTKFPHIYKKMQESGIYEPFESPQYNWHNFPDEELKEELSEKDFRIYIKNHFTSLD
ncbi:SinI family restriction endonuclease [SAR86 cluster bacterium]|nr:SinI family restriction endonuclease [SAR86 cluster bacterium]